MVLPWLAAAWLVGVAAAANTSLATWHWLTLSLVASLGAWLCRQARPALLLFAALVSLTLASARTRWAIDRRTSASIAQLPGEADVIGTVRDLPSHRSSDQSFHLDATWASEGGEFARVAGRILVRADLTEEVRRGETIVVSGLVRPARSIERLSASGVLGAERIGRLAPPSPGLNAALDGVRRTLLDRLHAVLPAEEASLVAGVLLGIEETMPVRLREGFRATGTAHILAVSGFNVTIVAAAALSLFGTALGKRRGTIAAAIAVTGYTLLVGADPPVLRAAIMAGIVLLAARLGRQPQALAALGAAAILMTLASPSTLFDVGFQLSFLATLGLVLVARPMTERLRSWSETAIRHEALRPVAFLLGETFLITLVAQAATLPISAYTFGRVPLMALPANAMILPAQPPLMATGAVTAMASLISLPLGRLAAWLTWPFAAFTIRVTEFFASVPGADASLPGLPWAVPVGAYLLFGGLVWLSQSPYRAAAADFARRAGWAPVVLALGVASAGVWKLASEFPTGDLRVTALPSGAILVETPTGRSLAISGAASQVGLGLLLDELLPLSHPELDWLILVHPEASWEDAVETLGRHAPAGILLPSGTGLPAPGVEAGAARPPIAHIVPGTRLDLGDGADLEFLESHNNRWSIRISMRKALILMTDPAGVASPGTANDLDAATALILMGPGRRVGAALRNLRSSGPLLVVGCPAPGEPLPDPGGEPPLPTRVTTARHGWVRIETDGTSVRVTIERLD